MKNSALRAKKFLSRIFSAHKKGVRKSMFRTPYGMVLSAITQKLRSRMGPVIYILKLLFYKLRIYLGRRDIRVAEHLLDGPHIGAVH